MMPLVEAHRGDSSNAPENTLAAFERALKLGVPWIELDVRPAQDGTLVVIHDDTVDRTTDGSGAVADLTVEQLSRLDAGSKFSPAYGGERVPLLTDVLRLVAPTTTRINVEIKSSPESRDVPRAVVGALRQFGRQGDYIVSSFEPRYLLDVRAIAPEIKLALIGEMPEILALAGRHGFPWIHGNHQTVTKEAVACAHAQGLHVNAWTVDDATSWPFWRDVGIDKICTNQPAEMLAAAMRRGWDICIAHRREPY